MSFSEFMQCLLRLYNCQERGVARCPDVQLCQKPVVEPVVTETEELEPVSSTIATRPTTTKPAQQQKPISTQGTSDSK